MPGLEDLYREIILDHYRTPRNRGELEPPAIKTDGHNPLCGDEITVYLDADDCEIEQPCPPILMSRTVAASPSPDEVSTSRYTVISSPHSGLCPSVLIAGGSSSPRFRGVR